MLSDKLIAILFRQGSYGIFIIFYSRVELLCEIDFFVLFCVNLARLVKL